MHLFRSIYTRVKDGSVLGGGDPKKPQVTDAAKQCFACHQAKKDQDYVYSAYIPGSGGKERNEAAIQRQLDEAPTRAAPNDASRMSLLTPFTPACRPAPVRPGATMSKMDAAPRSCCSTAAAR